MRIKKIVEQITSQDYARKKCPNLACKVVANRKLLKAPFKDLITLISTVTGTF